MNRALRTLWLLLGAALCGCMGPAPARRPALAEGSIAPLNERQFDAFANRLAAQLPGVLRRAGGRTPITLGLPQVDAASVESAETAQRFAQRLADGLNDRLAGAVVFRRNGAPDGPAATLTFSASEDGRARQIRFVLRDARAGGVLLDERVDYAAASPRRGDTAPRAAPVRLRIDLDEREITERLLPNLEAYRGQSLPGPRGTVCLVDEDLRARYWLLAIRAGQIEGERLRVELDIRSRQRERTARLRIIFLNEQGEPVEIAAPKSVRLVPYEHRTVALTSSSAASRYLCLFGD